MSYTLFGDSEPDKAHYWAVNFAILTVALRRILAYLAQQNQKEVGQRTV